MSLVKSVKSVPIRTYTKILGATCAGFGAFILYRLFRANKSDKKEVSLGAKEEAKKVKNGKIELKTDYDEEENDDSTEYVHMISGVRQVNNNRDDGGELVSDGRRQVQKRTAARQTPYTVPKRVDSLNLQHVEDRNGHREHATEEDREMVFRTLREVSEQESGSRDGLNSYEPVEDLEVAENGNLLLDGDEQVGDLDLQSSMHLIQRQLNRTGNVTANAPVRTVSDNDDQQVPQ